MPFSGSDAALHHLAGHRLAAPAPVCAGRTGCCHADPLADLHRSAADAFPKIQDAPICSAVLAWVITAPLPLLTSITDGGWSFLAGGIVLYALYNHKRLRLVVWAAMTFLCDFVLVFLQVRGLPDFAFSQMFTVYYEWLGVFAVIGMALYNGQRGSGHKQLFYWFYPAHVYLLYGASCLVYSLLQ